MGIGFQYLLYQLYILDLKECGLAEQFCVSFDLFDMMQVTTVTEHEDIAVAMHCSGDRELSVATSLTAGSEHGPFQHFLT